MSYTMYAPTRVLFGAGQLNQLHTQRLSGTRALLVISSGKSVRENGALDRTLQQLKLAGVEVQLFNRIQANPTKAAVMAGAQTAREGRCDFVVALGGGSVMDAAKIIAMMAPNPGDLWDYVSGGTGKGKTPPHPPLPVVCITTTAGTGSEVDQWGVVSNEETQEKIGCGGLDSLFPVLAIVDPELMVSVPPKFTAYQGFDTLFHATEVYIGRAANLMSDMVALTAIENVGRYLARAVADGTDLEAREHMAFANTMSGYAMVTGCCPERFVRMAQALGKADAAAPQDFIQVLADLQKQCGVDDLKLSDYGMTPDEFDQIAENARTTMGGLFAADPCALTHADCVEILRRSYR